MKIQIILNNPLAKVPTKSSPESAGYDLYSIEDIKLDPHSRKLISTGIKIKFPKEYYGRVAPRSGLSCKGIDIGAGVIDSDYRGEIKVLLINNSENIFNVEISDRIAQLIFEKYENDAEFELVDILNETYRGCKGFGSSGK